MDTNGTPLADQLTEARQRLELARLQTRTRLLEKWAGFDPAQRDQADDDWIPVRRQNTQGGVNQPDALTEQDLANMWANARRLTSRNPFATGALRSIVNYTAGTGFAWEAEPVRGVDADRARPVAEAAQKCLDEFAEFNGWAERERGCVERSFRDGEVFLRLFTRPDEWPCAVRYIRPEQVTAPPDPGPEWLWGVRCLPGDVETPEAYGVVYSESDGWEEIPAAEVYHFKRNVDAEIKRGMSDFFGVDEAFNDVWKLLRSMRQTAAVQANFAWFEQFSDVADEDTLYAAVQARKDTGRAVETNSTTGKTPAYEKTFPGTVKVVGAGRTYIPAPLATNTAQHVSIVQACLRAIGIQWNMAEYHISGDASNNAFASTQAAGMPYTNTVLSWQYLYGRFFKRVLWDVLRHACACGRLPYPFAEVEACVDLVGTPPEIVKPDPVAQATADAQDIAAGVMSKQTRRERIGLDNDAERQRIAEEPTAPPAGAGGNPFAAMLGAGAADTPEPEPAPAPPEQADAVKGNDLRSTVGGLQAIAALQADYYAGKLPREAAVANVKLLFGFSDQEAADLFPATAPVKLTPDPAPAVAGATESRLQEAISEAYRRLTERLRA